MTNPQIENGHVDIANELVEALARIRLSGEEGQVLWALLRKTYGWHKKEDRISLSQFGILTGLKKQTVHRAIKKLSSKMMMVIKNDYGQIRTYGFNKHYEEWKPSSKKVTVEKPSSILIKGVIKNDDGPSSKMMNTKEKKETLTKEKVLFSETFLLFWEAYPKKVGKLEAWKTWERARKSGLLPSIEEILKSIKQQKAGDQWCKEGGQYIPNPATWLNQGRWDDKPLKLNTNPLNTKPTFSICPNCKQESLTSRITDGKCWKCP